MTTYKQKFDALIESSVKAACARFLKDGEIQMTTWLVEDKHDVRILIAFTPDIPKDEMVCKMREIAREKDIVRYCVEMEAWTAIAYGDDTRKPSERDDRLEAVVVFGQDRQNNNRCVTIEIERKGDKVYLGEAVYSSNINGGAFRLFEEET